MIEINGPQRIKVGTALIDIDKNNAITVTDYEESARLDRVDCVKHGRQETVCAHPRMQQFMCIVCFQELKTSVPPLPEKI